MFDHLEILSDTSVSVPSQLFRFSGLRIQGYCCMTNEL